MMKTKYFSNTGLPSLLLVQEILLILAKSFMKIQLMVTRRNKLLTLHPLINLDLLTFLMQNLFGSFKTKKVFTSQPQEEMLSRDLYILPPLTKLRKETQEFKTLEHSMKDSVLKSTQLVKAPLFVLPTEPLTVNSCYHSRIYQDLVS